MPATISVTHHEHSMHGIYILSIINESVNDADNKAKIMAKELMKVFNTGSTIEVCKRFNENMSLWNPFSCDGIEYNSNELPEDFFRKMFHNHQRGVKSKYIDKIFILSAPKDGYNETDILYDSEINSYYNIKPDGFVGCNRPDSKYHYQYTAPTTKKPQNVRSETKKLKTAMINQQPIFWHIIIDKKYIMLGYFLITDVKELNPPRKVIQDKKTRYITHLFGLEKL